MSAVRRFDVQDSLLGALPASPSCQWPRLAASDSDPARTGLAQLTILGLERLDALLLDLETVAAPAGAWTRARTEAARRIAAGFVGLASQAGLPDLENAARSLCEVADGLIEQDHHVREPVRVHVEAMRLLRLPEALGRNIPELLAGLAMVRQRFVGGWVAQERASVR